MKTMTNTLNAYRSKRTLATVIMVLLTVTLAAPNASATTYISAEPIPSIDIVGAQNLSRISGIGYTNLELWSNRLLNDCRIVQNVIDVLTVNGAIHTVNLGNTRFVTAAGGFEAVTDPSYVFTIRDSGLGAVSAADIDALDNALGYVLNQGGTTHFSPDNPKAYAFALDYAVVTFSNGLTGTRPKEFFDYLGTINPALWSGQFAGFTQIDLDGSPTNNSMLFLKPAASKREFISGLSTAAANTADATYAPINNHGEATTARGGVAFPGNDWIAFPNGDQYLSHLGNASPQLLAQLAGLRQQHLQAVANLLKAIERRNVSDYLEHGFKCPA